MMNDDARVVTRRRWLLTLSAFGIACGQAPAPPMDSAQTDAIDDRSSMMDTWIQDARSIDVETDVFADGGYAVDSSDVNTDRASDSDAGVGAYPEGPYGNMEGQLLEDLQLQGYVNIDGAALSTMLAFGPTSLQALRQTGRRYALIHTSATY
jgi:hypothetical protein